jgi:DNA-binding transcriptional LysR family regulator
MDSIDALSDIQIRDIVTFIAVARSGSVSTAARSLGATPSQISKAIARIEKRLGAPLLLRGARGVRLNEAGQRALVGFEDAIAQLRRVNAMETGQANEITVAAPSYLQMMFLPAIAKCRPSIKVRGLELPPALLRAYAGENFFQIALMLSYDQLPKHWESVAIGFLRKGLFASPALAAKLGPQPVLEDRLRDIPFIGPVYSLGGSQVPVGDDCPAEFERRIGHQAQTMASALELAAETDQLLFGAAIAARHHLARRELVEIHVKGWAIRTPLLLACNVDRVRSTTYQAILEAVRERLAALERKA